MAIYKTGKCSNPEVKVSASVYVCSDCGHTEITSGKRKTKKCPKCGKTMNLVSNDTGEGEE
jgi:rubrerythrin